MRVTDVGHLDDAAGGGRGQRQQPVVGADEDPLVGRAQRDRPAFGPDVGIDHRQMDADGHVRERAAEDDRPGADVVAGHAVGDVDHSRRRADLRHHPVAHADEVVLEPVVGQERDHRGGSHARAYPALGDVGHQRLDDARRCRVSWPRRRAPAGGRGARRS